MFKQRVQGDKAVANNGPERDHPQIPGQCWGQATGYIESDNKRGDKEATTEMIPFPSTPMIFITYLFI